MSESLQMIYKIKYQIFFKKKKRQFNYLSQKFNKWAIMSKIKSKNTMKN